MEAPLLLSSDVELDKLSIQKGITYYMKYQHFIYLQIFQNGKFSNSQIR